MMTLLRYLVWLAEDPHSMRELRIFLNIRLICIKTKGTSSVNNFIIVELSPYTEYLSVIWG